MPANLTRTACLLIVLATLLTRLATAQTTCTLRNGPVYAGLTSLVLETDSKHAVPAVQMTLSSISSTPIQFTVGNIQSVGGWLSVYPTGGSPGAPQFSGQVSSASPFEITIFSNSFPPGSVAGQQYTGQFTITPAIGAPILVPVTLNLGPQLNTPPTVSLNPSCISFTQPGGPSVQTLIYPGNNTYWSGQIGASSDPVSYIVSSTSAGQQNWLQIAPPAAKAPYMVDVALNSITSLLSTGVYSGRVTFTTFNGPSFSAPVTLSVTQGLNAAPASLQFNTAGTAQQTLTLTGGTSGFVAAAQTALNINTPGNSGHSGWLTISPSGSITTPANLTVSVDATGLPAGSLNGEIDLIVGSLYRRIPVALTVPIHGNVVATSASGATLNGLAFTGPAGGGASSAQQVQISGASGTNGIAFTYQTSAPWLLANGSQSGQAVTPASLTVTINSGALALGAYATSITVTPVGGQPLAIPVTLNVVPSVLAVTNAASFLTGPIAAGEIVTIFGTGLGPPAGTPLTGDLIVDGQLPRTLGGVQVLIGGTPAPLLYAGATQVSAIVPYEIAAPDFLPNPSLQVKYQGQVSLPFSLRQAAAAPAIFAISKGSGPGAILNSDSSVNSSANPAAPGDIVVLFITGEGPTDPPGVTGKITAAEPPFPRPLQTPVVTIGGQPAQVVFYGEAPGQTAGLMQLNVRIPSTTFTGDAPVVVAMGTATSQTVTVAIRTVP